MVPCGNINRTEHKINRDSAGNSDTTDDRDRGGFQIKSVSRAFVISAARQANGVTAE
jgi:hypothetical protein